MTKNVIFAHNISFNVGGGESGREQFLRFADRSERCENNNFETSFRVLLSGDIKRFSPETKFSHYGITIGSTRQLRAKTFSHHRNGKLHSIRKTFSVISFYQFQFMKLRFIIDNSSRNARKVCKLLLTFFLVFNKRVKLFNCRATTPWSFIARRA